MKTPKHKIRMGHQNMFDKQQIKLIKALRKTGKTHAEIAKKFKVCAATIARYLRM